MTFKEWREKYSPYLKELSGGAAQVFYSGTTSQSRMELYHLSDYVVSSAVSGPSFIVVKRNDAHQE